MQNLILTGGKIFGGSGWAEPTWCNTLLIRHGLVESVGDYDEIKTKTDVYSEIKLDGAIVLPGLCDAHLHMAVGGQALHIPNLEGLDLDGVVSILSDYRDNSDLKNMNWISAFNWETWRCSLNASILEDIFPGQNVVVWAKDLHTCCGNLTALKNAGINRETETPASGIIDRDEEGNPTGVLREAAADLISEFSLHPTSSDIESSILTAQDYFISLGLTAVSEVLNEDSEAVYKKLDAEDRLMLEIDAWKRIDYWRENETPPKSGKRFQLNTIKVFLDGALGSHTAALSEPYIDEPDQSGVLFYTDKELFARLSPAVKAGWKVAIHAIGDRAVSQACRVLKRLPRVPAGPHRIEHLQILPENGIEELIECRALASIQPVHLADDQRWLPDRISEDSCRRTSVWRSVFDAGIPLALGTDWPVASVDPRLNLHAAINRAGFGESAVDCFVPGEGLPPYAAIRAATHGWAVAAGVSERRGSIAPGMSADLTVLSGVSEDLRNWSIAEVEMTVCRGEVVYKR